MEDSRIRVFMHCDGGLLDECSAYEVYIAPPEDFLPSCEEADLRKVECMPVWSQVPLAR